MKSIRTMAAEELWAVVSRHFPGVTAETLRQGWIPIPGTYVEDQVRRWARSVEGIESISLCCRPDHFRAALATSKYLAKIRVSTTIEARRFAVNSHERVAVFTCGESVELRGRNLLGELVAYLAGAIVLRAIRSTETAASVFRASRGAVELEWPDITVRLDEIAEVRSLMDKQVSGLTLLDIWQFGPIVIAKDCVQLKVGWAERTKPIAKFICQRLGDLIRQRRK